MQHAANNFLKYCGNGVHYFHVIYISVGVDEYLQWPAWHHSHPFSIYSTSNGLLICTVATFRKPERSSYHYSEDRDATAYVWYVVIGSTASHFYITSGNVEYCGGEPEQAIQSSIQTMHVCSW